jgi:hypothetical protein
MLGMGDFADVEEDKKKWASESGKAVIAGFPRGESKFVFDSNYDDDVVQLSVL